MNFLRASIRRAGNVPFAVLIAFFGINAAVRAAFFPHTLTTAGEVGPPVNYLWAALYGLGGLGVLLGIVLPSLRVEAAGCIAFAGGALIQALITWVKFGGQATNGVIVLLVFSALASLRAVHSIRGRYLVLVDRRGRVQ